MLSFYRALAQGSGRKEETLDFPFYRALAQGSGRKEETLSG